MTTISVPSRAEVDRQTTWNAESVFPDAAAWEAEAEAVLVSLPDIRTWQDRMATGPAELLTGLEAIFDIRERGRTVRMYAWISSAVDTTDQAATQRVGRAQSVMGQVSAAISFLEPALLAIGREQLESWMAREPELALYRHYFDDLFRQQAQVRSAEVEEVLGLLVEPFSATFTTYSKLTESDFTFKPAHSADGKALPLSNATTFQILHSNDREARRTAWENRADTFLAFKNTLASNLTASIKQNVLLMRVRRQPSTLEMALFKDNLPTAVFHNLIETFRRHLPTWQRYWRIRRRILGVDKLQPYDIWAPLTAEPVVIPYQQAVSWIAESLAPLGREYVDVLRRGALEERWIDVYPNQGKTAGAFSSGAHGTFPFIVMSYGDDALSMGTLAHELGHSMHSYWANRSQPPVYGDYTSFAAEVASNFHQAMLRAYLLEQAPDNNLLIAVIEEAMANFHRYFLVMPTLARFELETHRRVERGEGLTADWMIDFMADLLAEAYGEEMASDRQRTGITWAAFLHLYLDYYAFQYATGISGANALARRILSGTAGAAADYLGFLKAGSSEYVIEALRAAGVDLSSPEPVEQTFAVLDGLLDRLEEVTGG